MLEERTVNIDNGIAWAKKRGGAQEKKKAKKNIFGEKRADQCAWNPASGLVNENSF